MSDWAAKVLAGVPRYDPFWNRLVMITAKDGDYVEYDDATAAIAKLGAGDGLVNAVYLRDIDGTGSLHVCSKGDPGAIAHVPAAHIAALTAQLAEKEEQLVSVLQREAATQQRHDAKMEAAEAEAAALRAKLARIASAWPIVRDADCSGGTLASAMDEIEAAISDGGKDEATEASAALAEFHAKGGRTLDEIARAIHAAIADGGKDA